MVKTKAKRGFMAKSKPKKTKSIKKKPESGETTEDDLVKMLKVSVRADLKDKPKLKARKNGKAHRSDVRKKHKVKIAAARRKQRSTR